MARKGAAGPGRGTDADAAVVAIGASAGGQGQDEVAQLELPAELSEQQLRQLMRRVEQLLAAGLADQVLEQLQAAEPAFLAQHPGVVFALHRCRFLRHLVLPAEAGGGMAAAVAVVRQHMSPLAQQHPELQPQLKAAMAELLRLSAADIAGRSSSAAVQGPPQPQLQGVAEALVVSCLCCLPGAHCECTAQTVLLSDWRSAVAAAASLSVGVNASLLPVLQAIRAALRPRCHIQEPRLLVLLRELLRWAHCSAGQGKAHACVVTWESMGVVRGWVAGWRGGMLVLTCPPPLLLPLQPACGALQAAALPGSLCSRARHPCPEGGLC